jgi:hypothetical protein
MELWMPIAAGIAAYLLTEKKTVPVPSDTIQTNNNNNNDNTVPDTQVYQVPQIVFDVPVIADPLPVTPAIVNPITYPPIINVGGGVAGSTADPNATQETKQILGYLQNLRSQTSKKVLTGQTVWRDMNNLAAGNNWAQWDNCRAVTGQSPALFSAIGANWDNTEIRQRIIDHWSSGGLPIYHFMGGNGPEYWYGHVPLTTQEAIQTMSDPRYLAMLDNVVSDLLNYQNLGISFLLRILQEQNQSWSWWGVEDSSIFQQFWMQLYHYLTDRGVHNVLYWFCPHDWQGKGYLFGYPGDQYVDIVGVDSYEDSDSTTYSGLGGYNELTATGKPFIIGEYGMMGWGPPYPIMKKDANNILYRLKNVLPNIVGVNHWTTPYSIIDGMANPGTYMNDSYVANCPLPW